MVNTTLFKRLCETWRNTPAVDKTLKKFKTFFTKAEHDRSKHTEKEIKYINAISEEHIAEKMKNFVHDKLTTLLCAEALQKNGASPVSQNPIVKTKDTPTPTVEANAALNKN